MLHELWTVGALQRIIKEAVEKSQFLLRILPGQLRQICNEDESTDPWIGTSTDVLPLSVYQSGMGDHTPHVLDELELDNISLVKKTQSSESLEEISKPTPESAEPCTGCYDDESPPEKIIQLSCGHRYCQDCILRTFTDSMEDESLFPPRCCEKIPLLVVQHFLSPAFVGSFQMRQVEFDTPNPIYCCNRCCLAFIDPFYIVPDTAICPQCYIHTCTICKSCAHDGDCPEDLETKKFLATAAKEGYMECPSCGAVTDLSEGCNHMT